MLQILHLGTARCWQNLLPMGIEARPGDYGARQRLCGVFRSNEGWGAGGGEALCPGAPNDTAVRSRALRFYTCFLLKVVAFCSVWPRPYAASLASGAKGHFLD